MISIYQTLSMTPCHFFPYCRYNVDDMCRECPRCHAAHWRDAVVAMFSCLAVGEKHRLRKDIPSSPPTIEVEYIEFGCAQCSEYCNVQVQKLLRLVVHAAAAATSRSDRCCHEAPRVLQVRTPNSPLVPHIPTPLEAHHNTAKHIHAHAERHASPSVCQRCPPRRHLQWTDVATWPVTGTASPCIRHTTSRRERTGNAIHQPAPSRTTGQEARSSSLELRTYAERMATSCIDASRCHHQHVCPRLPLKGHLQLALAPDSKCSKATYTA